MSFTVPIRIDAVGQDAAISRVTTELDRMERAGKAAGEVVSRMLGAGKLHADQATEAMRRYTQEFIATERAAEKAASAIARIQPPKGLFDGAGGGMLSGAGLAGLAGGAAGIAAMATSKVLELGAAVISLGESYTNLDNRLRSIAPLEENRLALMDRTREVANASRSDWAATNELFVRLSSSTKEMGVSQERVLGLTETISKTFAKSGASSAEAAAGMLQLSQAFASGKLQGDEFKSLSESVPDVLDLIAKQMGVTRGELKKLSSEGLITGDVLVATFENAKNQIDEGFGRTAPTLSQSWAVFKNDMQATFGPLLQEFLPRVAAALKDIASTVGAIGDAIAKARSIAGTEIAGGTTVGDVAGGVWSKLKEGTGTPVMGILGGGDSGDGFGHYQKTMQAHRELLEKMAEQEKGWIAVLIDESQVVRDNIIGWGKFHSQLDDFLKTTRELSGNSTFQDQLDKLLVTTRDLANQPVAKEIGSWTGHFDQLGDAINRAADAVDDLTTKLLGADFVRGRQAVAAMFGQGGADLLQELSVAGEQAEGGWAQTRRDPNDPMNSKKTGGARSKAWEPETGYWDAVATDLKNAAGALQLFDFWADNSAEHFKFLLDLSEEARDKSVSGGVMGMIGGDPNAMAARDPNFLKPANDVERSRTKQINAEEVAMIRMQERAKETAEIMKTAFGSVENALVKLATTGEFSFKSMATSMLNDLARLAAHKLMMSLLGALMPTPGFGSFYGTGATQSFAGEFGSGMAHGGVFHAAHGDSWRIGGSSTVGDKVPFFAMVNSGEDVTVRSRFQQQEQRAANGNAGPHEIRMIDDRRALTAQQEEDRILKVFVKYKHRLR